MNHALPLIKPTQIFLNTYAKTFDVSAVFRGRTCSSSSCRCPLFSGEVQDAALTIVRHNDCWDAETVLLYLGSRAKKKHESSVIDVQIDIIIHVLYRDVIPKTEQIMLSFFLANTQHNFAKMFACMCNIDVKLTS